jgi:hypothetical protein
MLGAEPPVNWWRRWENLALFVLWQMLLPFAPLIAEWMLQATISDRSWFIFLSIYAFTLGSQSLSRLVFSFYLLVGAGYAALFGYYSNALSFDGHTAYADSAFWFALGLFVAHLIERFRRHLIDDEPFMEFGGLRR